MTATNDSTSHLTRLDSLVSSVKQIAATVHSAQEPASLSDFFYNTLFRTVFDNLVHNSDYQDHEDSESKPYPLLDKIITVVSGGHVLRTTGNLTIYSRIVAYYLPAMLVHRLTAFGEDITTVQLADVAVELVEDIRDSAAQGKWPAGVPTDGAVSMDNSSKLHFAPKSAITTNTALCEYIVKHNPVDAFMSFIPTSLGVDSTCTSCGCSIRIGSQTFEEGVLRVEFRAKGFTYAKFTQHTCTTLEETTLVSKVINFPSGKMVANDFLRHDAALEKGSAAVWQALCQTGITLDKLGPILLSNTRLDVSDIDKYSVYTAEHDTRVAFSEVKENSDQPYLSGTMGQFSNIEWYASLRVATAFGGNSTGYVWQRNDTVVITISSDADLSSRGFKLVGDFDMRYWWATVMDIQDWQTVLNKSALLKEDEKELLHNWNIATDPSLDTAIQDEMEQEGVHFSIKPGKYNVLCSLTSYKATAQKLAMLGEHAADMAKVLKQADEWLIAIVPAQNDD